MEFSILRSTKQALGIDVEQNVFDPELIMHINSVLMILNQLGIGPEKSFRIEDDSATWEDFIGQNSDVDAVKSYLYLKVRIMFDPPTTSFVLEALNRASKELEWRLNAQADDQEIEDDNRT